MKSASAIFKDGRVFIQAYAETNSGMWIAFGPVFACDIGQVTELESNIRTALQLSTRGVRQPGKGDWQGIQKPMLEAVGVKNWTLLAKRAKAVGLECEGGVVRLTPTAAYQKDGGAVLEEQVIISRIDADDLGLKLIEAFDISS